jgi:hypothetical protein
MDKFRKFVKNYVYKLKAYLWDLHTVFIICLKYHYTFKHFLFWGLLFYLFYFSNRN